MTTVGVLGGTWRADVTPGGGVVPWPGSQRPAAATAALHWWVAAEDRWHDPEDEPGVRQRCLDGTPVVETRVRVPGGDVVQRVFAVADAGGITVVEVENESPHAVAVAFEHGRLLSARPPADVPIAGIEVPAGAVLFPLAHQTTLRVGLAHDGSTGALPARLPPALGVVRGWLTQVERASRLVLPDWGDGVIHARCQLALRGPERVEDDAVGCALGVCELVRLGADAEAWVPEAVTAAERIARAARTCGLGWDGAAALGAVQRLLAAAHEPRGAADVATMARRLGAGGAPLPGVAPVGVRAVPWVEQRLALPQDDGTCTLVPDGHPWFGENWEAHHLPAGSHSRVSLAVRWHGARPALLWEVEGEPVVLRGGVDAPAFHSADPNSEVLWPEPVSRAPR